MGTVFKRKEIWLVIIIVAIVIMITSVNSAFFSADNFWNLVRNNSLLMIASLGMTVVIISGGIDVSISAVVTTIMMVVGRCIAFLGFNLFMAFLAAVAVGMALGFINGLLIGKSKLPAIVVTLGTLNIINGCLFLITGGKWVNGHQLPEWLADFGNSTVAGLPVQTIITILMAALTWFILKYTLVGRSVYAIGGNFESAARAGINMERTLLFIYVFMGFLAGIGSVTQMSIVKMVDPHSYTGLELQVIAAVVVGGARITGGKASILGTILGVVFVTIVNNGLVLMHIASYWQNVVVGAAIVVAVSIDAIGTKNAKKRIPSVEIY